MQIKWIRHAKNRLRSLKAYEGLTENDVLKAIKAPVAITPSIHGRKNLWQPFRNKWLRITVIMEESAITIITVTVRRKGPDNKGGAINENHL